MHLVTAITKFTFAATIRTDSDIDLTVTPSLFVDPRTRRMRQTSRMMAIGATDAGFRDIVQYFLLMLAFVRCSNGNVLATPRLQRSHYRRAFLVAQTNYFWSMRGGAEQDQTALDVSIGRKPSSKTLLYPVSVCSVRGLRDHMEDDFFVANDFAAVFDGHGGEAVAKYLRQNLYASIQACLPSSAANAKSTVTNTGSLNPKSLDSMADSLTSPRKESGLSQEQPQAPLTLTDYEKALVRALQKVDREIIRISHWSFQGSTAVACWILPIDCSEEEDDDDSAEQNGTDASISNEQENASTTTATTTIEACSQTADGATSFTSTQSTTVLSQPQGSPKQTHTLLTANIGDSRAVLSRNKTSIIELTRDHKPNDPLERQRIERVGGTIVWHGHVDRYGNPIAGTGVWRVNGNLALARAIGDRSERPAVTSEPELSIIQLTENDDFVIIATDGLWDVMSSCDCVAYVHALIEEAEEMGSVDYDSITYMLVEEALRRGSYDNITVILIWLQSRQISAGEQGLDDPNGMQ